MAREQQLLQFKRTLVIGQEQNAAEKQELAYMLQECRMPPSAPSTPRAALPAGMVPPLPVLPAPSSTGGEPPSGAMTVEEHDKLMKAIIGPLEEKLGHIQTLYENERKDKKILLADVTRLHGLIDSMQSELSEARDVVSPLPPSGARMAHAILT